MSRGSSNFGEDVRLAAPKNIVNVSGAGTNCATIFAKSEYKHGPHGEIRKRNPAVASDSAGFNGYFCCGRRNATGASFKPKAGARSF